MVAVRVTRNCKYCNAEVTTALSYQVYCSTNCSKAGHRTGVASSCPKTIAASTVGVIAELLVTADLMAKGYEVLRALSPAASCDLLILLPDKKPSRSEVRTGYRLPSGNIIPQPSGKDAGRQDVFAWVLEAGRKIVYRDQPFLAKV